MPKPLTDLGTYRTTVRLIDQGGTQNATVVVALQADLGRLAAMLAWTAARSRQRPRRATMGHGAIVATVVREVPESK